MTPTDDIPTLHEDDSYGDCVICREWVPHTDDEYRGVTFPCPTVRLARAEAALSLHRQADWPKEPAKCWIDHQPWPCKTWLAAKGGRG